MTAAPSMNSLLPRGPARRDNNASGSDKPPPGTSAPTRPARARRGPRGIQVVCLTLLAALASAGLWLDLPPATQDELHYVGAP